MKILRIVASFIIMFVLVGFTGCQSQKQLVTETKVAAPPSVETMDAIVYYLKDSNNEMYLVREVHKTPKSEGVARAALNELILGKPLTSGAFKVLPKDTKILGIKIENGLATVDFSKEVLKANVGSSGEMLGILSIVNTLTEFPTIQRVKFTVEGKAENAMGWWGHVGLYEQPFKRNLSPVYEPAIWVTSPIAGQTVKSTFKIKGNARVFEAFVSFRLKDSNGNILAKGSTRAESGAPERGGFEAELTFKPSSAGKGQLEIFEESMKDGSPINMVIIPVKW
nr:Gmad2 immunoglobulin-like domain-containing protein [Clostridium peptidivorans]